VTARAHRFPLREHLDTAHLDRTQPRKSAILTTWPDGQQTEPVDQMRSSETRVLFTREVLGRSIDRVESHWQAQVSTGKGGPPKTLSSDAAVIEYVHSKPGAVGSVSSDADTVQIRVIRVVD
jgi:hypothetical protein